MNKKLNQRYITKDEAIQAIRKSRTREEMELSIKSIKCVRLGRSRKIKEVYIKRDSEYCPHCRKSLDLFYLFRGIPRHVYCYWCGGAVIRPDGDRNPYFDYTLLDRYKKEKDAEKGT